MDNINVQMIMKEQLKLVKTEKQLKIIIEWINSQLNQLLIEQLQLKSYEIDTDTGQSSSNIQPKTNEPQIDNINSQSLNLDVNKIKTFMDFDDEDDED